MAVAIHEFRSSIRSLRRHWRFTLLTAFILALGFGSAAGTGTIVERLRFGFLPYRDADRLVVVSSRRDLVQFNRYHSWDFSPLPEMESNSRFAGVAAVAGGAVNLGVSPARRVRAASVAGSFFSTLGIVPIRGQVFGEAGAHQNTNVALISQRLWASAFGTRPDIVGHQVVINDRPFAIVGVLSEAVRIPNSPDVWIPSGTDAQLAGEVPRIIVVARLSTGVSQREAQDELRAIIEGRFKSNAKLYLDTLTLEPIRDWSSAGAAKLLPVLAMGGLVVLIAARLNTASLLIARLLERRPELAVRRALGATNLSLMRLITIESFSLAALGGILAVPIAAMLVSLIRTQLDVWTPAANSITFDYGLLVAICVAAGVGASIVIGVASLVVARDSWSPANSDARVVRGERRGAQAALIIAQICFAVVLVSAASTILLKIRSVLQVNLGVSPENVVVFQVELPRSRYAEPPQVGNFYRGLEDRIRSIAGVVDVATVTHIPGDRYGALYQRSIEISGLPRADILALDLAATPRYFDTAGARLVFGRSFNASDNWEAPKVVIATSGFAAALKLPPGELVGRMANLSPAMPDPTWAEIVGVVADDLRIRGGEDKASPALYLPLSQRTLRAPPYVVVRLASDRINVATAIQRALSESDPALVAYNLRSFPEVMRSQLADREFLLRLTIFMMATITLLAGSGLYALVRQSVEQRTREFALRLALGASGSEIGRQVIAETVRLATVGALAGAVLFVVIWRFVVTTSPNVGSAQPTVIAMVACSTALLMSVSCWRIVRIARSIEPSRVLRS